MDLPYGPLHGLYWFSSLFFFSQMQLSESSQPIWVAFTPTPDSSTSKEAEESSVILIKSGVVSHDGLWVHHFSSRISFSNLYIPEEYPILLQHKLKIFLWFCCIAHQENLFLHKERNVIRADRGWSSKVKIHIYTRKNQRQTGSLFYCFCF